MAEEQRELLYKVIFINQDQIYEIFAKGVTQGDLFGFVDSLTNKLSLDAVIGNPFARIVYPNILKPVLKELGPPLAVAIGLAMKDE